MQKIYYIMFFFSVAVMVASAVAFMIYGLQLGVDFRGGSIIELEFSNQRPAVAEVRELAAQTLPSSEFTFNEAGERSLVIRSGDLSGQAHENLLTAFTEKYKDQTIQEKSFSSVGPVIGQELKSNSVKGIIIALIAIVIYIAFVFRKMAVVLSPWAMSAASMMALFHDIIIPIGVFSALGQFYNIEISAVFVAALLTILGYSVSDTVVVFDRVRENVIRNRVKEGFGAIVHKSVMQTLARSLNTNFTTLLSLFAIYFFGGESLRFFALALIIGIFLGAYSSIFVASPVLVWWSDRFRHKG